jgi:hypothetical protein
MVNKIWTTSDANTPASTADHVQPKKALGTVREAITNPPGNILLLLNAAIKVLFPTGTADAAARLITNYRGLSDMTFGRGALLWLLGIPLPIILLLAFFWR